MDAGIGLISENGIDDVEDFSRPIAIPRNAREIAEFGTELFLTPRLRVVLLGKGAIPDFVREFKMGHQAWIKIVANILGKLADIFITCLMRNIEPRIGTNLVGQFYHDFHGYT